MKGAARRRDQGGGRRRQRLAAAGLMGGRRQRKRCYLKGQPRPWCAGHGVWGGVLQPDSSSNSRAWSEVREGPNGRFPSTSERGRLGGMYGNEMKKGSARLLGP